MDLVLTRTRSLDSCSNAIVCGHLWSPARQSPRLFSSNGTLCMCVGMRDRVDGNVWACVRVGEERWASVAMGIRIRVTVRDRVGVDVGVEV